MWQQFLRSSIWQNLSKNNILLSTFLLCLVSKPVSQGEWTLQQGPWENSWAVQSVTQQQTIDTWFRNIMKLETKIGFVGAGAMAQAIADGLLSSGTVEAGNIVASATSDRFRNWWEERGVKFSTDNNFVIEESDVVFIAVKPHLYSGMLDR